MLRAAGFGAGAVLTAAFILGILAWWSGRPAKPKPLNAHAITATFSGMEIRVRDDAFYLTVIYGLHNNTDQDYRLPPTGMFMIVDPENKGLNMVDGAKWDSSGMIPPGQTVNVKFDIPYQLSEYNRSTADLVPFDKETEFANNRTKETNGFRFFDNTQRYEIDFPALPVIEPEQRPSSQKQSAPASGDSGKLPKDPFAQFGGKQIGGKPVDTPSNDPFAQFGGKRN